jgi:peptidoglycan-N-acetylglucosamine deacetylase
MDRSRPRRCRAGFVLALLLAVSACTGLRDAAPPTVDTSATNPSTTTTSTTTATTATTTTPPTTTPATTTPATTPATTTPATTATTAPPTTTPPTTAPSGAASVAIDRFTTGAPVVALTLDAGSDLGYTHQILDTLSAKGVQASFGITGAFAEAHPDAVRRMAREGHLVMNHSYTHTSFTGVSSTSVLLSRAERQADLARADAVLEPLIGHSTVPYWRPPYGDYDTGVLGDVGAAGYTYTVMWTFDSLGWKGLSAEQIVERVIDRAQPGAIIVMHVGSQSQDGPALADVIDGLRSAGYSFTTIANAVPVRG